MERTGKRKGGNTTEGRRKGMDREEERWQFNGGATQGNGEGRGKVALQRRVDVRERTGKRNGGNTTEGLHCSQASTKARM